MATKTIKKGKSETEIKAVDGSFEVGGGINPTLYDEDPAFVNFKLGRVINLGNYESLRIEVGVTRPCKNNDEDINKTFDKIVVDIKDKLKVESNKMLGVEDEVCEEEGDLLDDLVFEGK